ncbi:MAG: hypothetical protein HP495_17675, partial [Nitrospira sp.]|nr:hypothetical protein [Nitrospira sp.]
MKRVKQTLMVGAVLGLLALFPSAGEAGVDREKFLKDPGVYGTFAVFQVDEEWWKL